MIRSFFSSDLVFGRHVFASEDFEFSTSVYASLDSTVYNDGDLPCSGALLKGSSDFYYSFTGSSPSSSSGFYAASTDILTVVGQDNLANFRGVSVAGSLDLHCEYFM